MTSPATIDLTGALDVGAASDEMLAFLYRSATREQFTTTYTWETRRADQALTGLRYALEQEMERRGTHHSRSAMILSAVPEADRALVGLHANLLGNTGGGRPSGNAFEAVRLYFRIGRDALHARHMADNLAALRACANSGCTTCADDAARRERVGV